MISTAACRKEALKQKKNHRMSSARRGSHTGQRYICMMPMTKTMKGEKKMQKKRIALMGVATALIATMAIGGTMAYLTDNEMHDNTFTIGNVKVDLVEANYNTTDDDSDGVPDAYEDLVPNQQVKKDPKVVNTGINDAIVFMKVTVPVASVTKVADNGTKGTKTNQELFYLQKAGTAIKTEANAFNTTNWIELTGKETGTDHAGSTRTYVFGYKTKVAKGAATDTLFDLVQVMNIVEGEIATDAAQTIKVETYAIQADNVINASGAAITTLDATSLATIYDIFVNQNGTSGAFTSEKEADTGNAKDLSGTDL